MRLKDRTAAVTGAGRGIGQAIAFALAREGARVVASDIDGDLAAQVASQIADQGGQAIAIRANVAVAEDAKALVSAAVESFDHLDILVNNAGIYPSAPVLDITEDEWDQVQDVNLKGTFLCSQAAAKQMLNQAQGAIVNITSVDAKTRTTGNAHYAAAKAGVISFTRSLANEMAPHGIRVNAVAPGWIATETLMTKSDRWRQAVKGIPVGRLGMVDDVAEAVLFLVSDVAGYITGEILDVNGGMVMD
jgi:3-oxoacyl-[acyl-carrier protein] reductase